MNYTVMIKYSSDTCKLTSKNVKADSLPEVMESKLAINSTMKSKGAYIYQVLCNGNLLFDARYNVNSF